MSVPDAFGLIFAYGSGTRFTETNIFIDNLPPRAKVYPSRAKFDSLFENRASALSFSQDAGRAVW